MVKNNGFPSNTKKYGLVLVSQVLSVFIFILILIPRMAQGLDSPTIESTIPAKPSVVLSLLPSSSTHEVNSVIPIQIYVNLNNSPAVNAFGIVLQFPTDYFEILEIDTGGSVCTLIPENKVSNDTGQARLSCGIPNPGLTEPFGFLGTVKVKLLKEGYANINFAPTSQVLANDGIGTDVLTKTVSTGVNIISKKKTVIEQPPLTPNPEGTILPDIIVSPVSVSSSSHPQQQEWYSNNIVKLEWEDNTDQITHYSYLFDRNPDTKPSYTTETASNSTTFSATGDGVWYFHIMPLLFERETPVSHFQVQIDTDTPRDLKVKSAESFGEGIYWSIEMEANDYNGIERYEITHQDGTVAEVNNPARIILNNMFERDITITAYDFGGNSASVDYQLPVVQKPTVWDKAKYWWANVSDYLRSI